ncbi:MAG: ribosome maturation factor RimM [Bacteroidia bacterium]
METVEIGYFSKTQGLKGALNLVVKVDFDIESCEVLFVDTSSGNQPMFIKEFRESKNGFVILLEDVNNIDEAQVFTSRKVYVKDDLVFKNEADDWLGFRLIDENYGEVGVIKNIEYSPAGDLIVLEVNEKEVLLPLNDNMVKKVDTNGRLIQYCAPDGLIEMYLKD